jgi:UPF0271 protein
MYSIDFNCDMGESVGEQKIGDDEGIMPFVSSINIACGFHGGNPTVIDETIRMAIDHGIAIGAHPSFNDLEGFGRREMALTPEQVYQLMVYQIAAIKGFTTLRGAELHHVKPHGALYNMAAKNYEYALAIAEAIADIDDNIILYGLSGSQLIDAGEACGLMTCSEVFADRTYQNDGSLTPRSQPNALIESIDQSIQQVLQMIQNQLVVSIDGTPLTVKAETICIHGDGKEAKLLAKQIYIAVRSANCFIKPPIKQ